MNISMYNGPIVYEILKQLITQKEEDLENSVSNENYKLQIKII